MLQLCEAISMDFRVFRLETPGRTRASGCVDGELRDEAVVCVSGCACAGAKKLQLADVQVRRPLLIYI